MASRRAVLAGLSSTAMLALDDAQAGNGYLPPHGEFKCLVDSMFTELDAARAVGGRFLASHPLAETNARRLAARLVAGRPGTTVELRRLVSRCRREDARRRSFVDVDGWMMPSAEAEICALTVLLERVV